MESPDTPTRKLAAIMFTDIAGYTKLSSTDDTKAAKLLNTQRDLLKPIVEKYGGSWLKEIGDGLLITFKGATSALECAIEIQKTTKDIDDLNLRIGIHQGEIIEQKGDVIGDDVNVASRIEPFSAIGGIAVSDKVQRDISSNPKFTTKYIGKPQLKGVQQKVEVYCITSHGLPETKLSDVSAKLEKKTSWFRYAVSAVAVVALLTYYFIPKEKEVPSIGILMMENLGIEDDNFWSRGITEDLIIKVAGAGLIRVAPMKEILEIDVQKSFEEIAKKLRVKYLLTSSMHKKEEGFDLRCQLIEAESGVSTYAKKWSESIDNSPTIVGNLANDILKTLKVSSKQDITEATTTNTEAYEFYLKAKYKNEKHENMEDTEIARGLLRKAIELDDNLLAAKNYLGYIYYQTGDYDKGMEIYTSALKQAEELGDKYGIGNSLNSIGNIYEARSDLDKALDYYERSLKIYEELGNKLGMGRSLHNIGGIYHYKGDLDKALDYFKRSLAIREELGDKRGIGASLNNIGIVYRNKGDYDKAIDYYGRSLKIYEELDNKLGMGTSLLRIGWIYYLMGELTKAIEYYDKELSVRKELKDENRIANIYNNYGLVYLQQNDFNKALENLEKSATMQVELDSSIALETASHLFLSKKILGKEYNNEEIYPLIKEGEEIEYYINYALFKLLENTSYLETAYNQIQEKADAMEDELRIKFLNYPISKAIVEEWEKNN